MKKIFIFSILFMFVYAGFRPPEGMRKFPVANLQFNVQTPKGNVSASLKNTEKKDASPKEASDK